MTAKGFHAKPVNAQLRSHSLIVQQPAKARMSGSIAPGLAACLMRLLIHHAPLAASAGYTAKYIASKMTAK